jgi:hypothetical protein
MEVLVMQLSTNSSHFIHLQSNILLSALIVIIIIIIIIIITSSADICKAIERLKTAKFADLTQEALGYMRIISYVPQR